MSGKSKPTVRQSIFYIQNPFVLVTVLFLLSVTIAFLVYNAFFQQSGQSFVPLPGNSQFPNSYPDVPADSTPDSDCLGMVLTEGNVRKYRKKLKACNFDSDCSGCESKKFQITCQEPSAAVARDQQNRYNQSSKKYCLPKLQQCIKSSSFGDTCDFSTGFVECDRLHGGNSVCDSCNDIENNGTMMKCYTVQQNQTVNIDDQSCTYTGEVPKSVCLPERTYCNPKNGTATWTNVDGVQQWACKCNDPAVFGGDSCNTLIACGNNLLRDETKSQQSLIINVGERLGEPWTPESTITPNVNVCAKNPSKSCEEPGKPCSSAEGDVCSVSTICQCDGLSALTSTGIGFMDDPNDLNNCIPDPCSYNINGGRYADPEEIVPGTSADDPCICSGASSSLWTFDKTDKTYTYTGRCHNKKKGNVTFKANEKCLNKDVKVNSKPSETGLVNVPRTAQTSDVPPGTAQTSDGGPQCIPDPCRGGAVSLDPYYPPSQESGFNNAGVWDPTCNEGQGCCTCDTDQGAYKLTISEHNKAQPTYPIATNPLDQMCYFPCGDVDSLQAKLCQGHSNCTFDANKPFGYRCNCPSNFKPNSDSTACIACQEKGVVSNTVSCCGKGYSCVQFYGHEQPSYSWCSCSNASGGQVHCRELTGGENCPLPPL